MKTTRLSFLVVLVLVCGLTASVAFATTEAAKVNDKVITLEEVNTRLAEEAHANPMAPLTKKMVLDELIKQELVIEQAKKMKLEQDPMVTERVNNVLFVSYLEKKLQPEFDKMTVSDAEAKNWYEKNPEIRTSHIFVALPPDATSDDEKTASKKLSEIASEIKAGKMSFAEAAAKNSEDPSSNVGGDLEYRMKDRLDPSYYRAALKLGKNGDITSPIRSAYGMHIIRLTGKHSWNEVDRNHVKRIMFEERHQELVDKLLNGMRQKANVTVNTAVIKE
jgi:EpsD family peptidyl-prolyl cis-trans isomerase